MVIREHSMRLAFGGEPQITSPHMPRKNHALNQSNHFLPNFNDATSTPSPTHPSKIVANSPLLSKKNALTPPSSPCLSARLSPVGKSAIVVDALERAEKLIAVEHLRARLGALSLRAQGHKDHVVISQACKSSIFEHYPQAMTTLDLDTRVAAIAHTFGFSRNNTLLARCFCPDEVNSCVTQLGERYCGEFDLGGLAGIPFAGVTGMCAFRAHVPDDGNIIIMYGPHVGINDSGELGRMTRRGQRCETTACGSAIAALHGLFKDPNHTVSRQTDYQQHMVVQVLRKNLARLRESRDPIMTLGEILFECIEERLLKIIKHNLGDFYGKILLVGGVQVNTHHGLSDHFVPRTFGLLHPKGQEDLSRMLLGNIHYKCPPMQPRYALQEECLWTIESEFPTAMLDTEVVLRAQQILRERGMHQDNTLFADSSCPDEVNRIPELFRSKFGSRFSLGGLTGLPFCGKTGYGAFQKHVPVHGNVFIIYGPHIGVSEDGVLGQVHRYGQSQNTTACGSAIYAYDTLKKDPDVEVDCEVDYQQHYVTDLIKNHWPRVSKARKPVKESTAVLLETIERDLLQIIDHTFEGQVVLLGGTMVNIPSSGCDYFAPSKFVIMETGKVTEDLLPYLMPQ